ncbi:DoxX family protein [Dysgonomonas sp. Marseille-P4677]|uniref:BT_3928 family protein n=1 Tax=Dysgonomonas sp. Marseille-P4677 TaxID=2364790 RepID=UPI0019123EC7|nr:BT_3928 family protein [Dysgonomonas sp. Marseille-P4677]MBK5721643.1 DoxX family protein [Dysgonomonas sp. Marseille-P4677]
MSKKDICIKILVEISRIILGVTFIFSGFAKAVDPFGFAFKIEDYFAAFHLSSLSFLALPISALLCIGEFAMGACMLFGLYRRWNSRLMLAVMAFMTVLTFYLAIANPVDDCGCFGDALVITNWQTFYKNIVLLVCSVIALLYCERISNIFTGKTYWLAFLYIIIFISLFVFRNYLFEPVIDFRPYKIGANIPELMGVEEGQGREQQTLLVYAKDGIEKEFTEDNYPWEDSTWVFVRMDTKVISEGAKSPIKDFVITDLSFDSQKAELVGQNDITDSILSDSNYVFLMLSPSLEDMNMSYLSDFEDIDNYASDNGYKFYLVTSSTTEEIMTWARENVINFNFSTMDERAIKTVVRANPGLILLKKGVVINKWAGIEVPSEVDLKGPLDNLSYGQLEDAEARNKRVLFYICSVFLLPLLGLKGLDFLFFRRRRNNVQGESEIEEDHLHE